MKTIKQLDLKGKKVIIRCDLNVPINNKIILDDNRIKQSLRTIKYAKTKKAKVIIMSHLGRIKSTKDKEKYSLKPVAKKLEELLEQDIIFIPNYKGKELETAINNLKDGQILLMENTRFADLDKEAESKNNKKLARYWASLADIFINDAFGTAHRIHASNVGIAKNLPNAIGFLMQKELKYLSKKPKKPYTIILGGSKVSDKIGVIESLIPKADYILIGGAMAFTFLYASGFKVGKSLIEKDYINYCVDMLSKYDSKIILPIDIITAIEIKENIFTNERFINEIKEDEIGLDIGPKTVKLFKQYINESNTVFFNGTLGYCEIEEFANGTKNILDALSKSKATTIIGGGDTASACISMGYKDKMSHVSTGGGASLEFLEGKSLPALDVIDE